MSHFEWSSPGYTDEKARITEVLLSIIEGLPFRRQLLDIGPGNGDITTAILSAFTSTVLVEPHFTDLRLPTDPEMIAQKWEDVPVVRVKGRFDLVLCSHTLYYMDEGAIDEQVYKMYQSLTKEGVLVLVLNAPGTLLAQYQATVYPIITDPIVKWIYSSSVVDRLYQRYPKLRRRTIDSCINAPNAQMLVNLLYSISGAGHDRDKAKLINITWNFVKTMKLVEDGTSKVVFPLKAHAYIISPS